MYNIALPKNQEFLDFDMYPCSKKEVIVPYVCLPACLPASTGRYPRIIFHLIINAATWEVVKQEHYRFLPILYKSFPGVWHCLKIRKSEMWK